jgi:poly-gamma-glutamate system protein
MQRIVNSLSSTNRERGSSRETSLTTDAGNLEAKQTAINPNWAAVIVDLLQQANVKERDPVAVSFSGSFPALNIAVGTPKGTTVNK